MFRRRALRRRLVACGAPPLDARQLRQVARALDAGAAGALCVAGPTPLRLAALRATRWPDLRDAAGLRRAPRCAEPLCCNPYHWSRVCKPETPPPPYKKYAMEDVKSKEQGVSTEDARRTDHERLRQEPSLTTDGEVEKPSWESEWCRLAYWEQARRVGHQVGVRLRAVDVFGAAGDAAHGLCLDALASAAPPQGALPSAPSNAEADEVRKTRAKIGLGVTLSLEADGVWLYNRSSEPVFVSSPALDAAAARALLVWRVGPGHCLCVFDPAVPPPLTALPHLGPVDPRSVRISFAKGWGPKYRRRDVTACPCWLEVLLAPHS